MSGYGLSALVPLIHLRELDLSSSGLTDASATILADFPNLKSLSVDFTRIGDNGARAVFNGCILITYLGLQETCVTDECFDNIRGDSLIDTIDVMNTSVTCSGLAKLHVLKRLSEIYYNGDVDEYGAMSLRTISSLRFLNLGDDVSEDGRRLLEKCLPGVDIS